MTSEEPPSGGVRKPSKTLNRSDVAVIKRRILKGEFLNRIAADFDVNPGRISEIKSGYKYADVPPSL